MLELLEKYNKLASDLRAKLDQPAVVTAIKNLEDKYKVSLVDFVMRVMIKEITPDQFIVHFIDNFSLNWSQARELALDLRHSVFFDVAVYVYGLDDPLLNVPAKTIEPVKPIATPVAAPTVKLDELTVKAMAAIKQTGVSLSSQQLIDRLTQSLVIYLKGVRDRLSTKELLLKPVASGGLALDSALANNLLDSLDGRVPSTAKTTPKPAWLEPRPAAMVRDADYDLTTLPNLFKDKALPAPVEPLELTVGGFGHNLPIPVIKAAVPKPSKIMSDIAWPEHVVAPPDPITAPIIAPKPVPVFTPDILAPQPVTPTTPSQMPNLSSAGKFVPTPSVDKKAPSESNWQKSDSGKVLMNDVLTKPRTYTPIDEFRYITIKNFRQLNPDPVRATELLWQKATAITEEDISKKVELSFAWKQSPLNRMYVAVFRSAMNDGQSVAQALAVYQKQEADFLTTEELDAIINFNKRLTTGHQ